MIASVGKGGKELDVGASSTARGCSRSGSTIFRYDVKISGRSLAFSKGMSRLPNGQQA